MAEALLRHRLGATGAEVRVSSAGLLPGGRPATAHGQAVMADRGLDLSGHESRRVDSSMVAQADLIVGMAREHVREVAVIQPDALARAFTLKELVRAATAVGPRRSDEPLEQWLRTVAAGRRREALVGVGHDDSYDIADPVGGSRLDYNTTADELTHLLDVLVAMIWPAGLQHGQERSA